ncbi:uncharacterized protein SPAPADRAFT_62483 [Spathaspora passalidarum NRRL Y-27907]|uniref:Uncharacterized protein n=1 Tax=Spathaspora passalidarum (strain NRRL Y-27907 / 11-Y1) TaxID=619300 RepID=G3AS24_SPAPN|nr:uncharacterized protein SPAPADRAFT_62483 [Spathaspora passalidarum NRRL Y-27907]EGW31873.1 hypothetical protein SPAPADRAFT_62483 [Spathaspora passalidarum NRRL Y-27907]
MRFAVQEGGKYIACSISRHGKNEIRFYKLSQENETVTSSVANSIFLENSIIDIIWSTSVSKSPKRRKRTSEDTPVDISNDTLIALDESGNLIVLSPLSNKPIKQFTTRVPGTKLIKADNFIWIKSKDSLIKYSSDDDTVISIQVPSATTIEVLPGKAPHVVLSDGSKLSLGKIVKNKFVQEHELEIKGVTQIIQSKTKPDLLAVLADELYIVNLKDLDHYTKIEYTGNATVLSTVSYIAEEYIQVSTQEKVYLVRFGDKQVSKTITTNNVTELFTHESILVGAYKDLNDVEISDIHWISDNEGEIINTETTKSSSSSLPNAKIHIPKITAINNVEYSQLLETLLEKLNSTELNKNSIVKLCSSINNEETIKQTIKALVFDQVSNTSIEKLYSIISNEVSKDCSINKSLGIWLKWILLTYGGVIAKSDQSNLKNLQKELSSGLELLPHLIVIQGRLQLLTLQSEIRQKVIDIEESTEEKDIVYANGEGDDDLEPEVVDIDVA